MAILHMAQARKNVSCAPHRNANGKHRTAVLAAAGIAMLGLAGCRQDMHNQPKMIPQRGSVIFADHRSARPQVPNTVARGIEDEDSYFYTGLVQGANGYKEEKDALPFPVSMTVLEKGQERFNIYCTPCHSRVGNGAGAIVMRGYKPAANLNDQVRRAQPLGHYFYVMTHGYGAMPDYSAQLTPSDRWAVAAYIRALQLSQSEGTAKDVPSGTKVDSLKNIAAAKGDPASFAEPWELPAATAIQAYPPVASEGTPAMNHGYPSDPEIKVPHTAAPATAKPAAGPVK
jgi:mono/diheme cytochrome c family protein